MGPQRLGLKPRYWLPISIAPAWLVTMGDNNMCRVVYEISCPDKPNHAEAATVFKAKAKTCNTGKTCKSKGWGGWKESWHTCNATAFVGNCEGSVFLQKSASRPRFRVVFLKCQFLAERKIQWVQHGPLLVISRVTTAFVGYDPIHPLIRPSFYVCFKLCFSMTKYADFPFFVCKVCCCFLIKVHLQKSRWSKDAERAVALSLLKLTVSRANSLSEEVPPKCLVTYWCIVQKKWLDFWFTRECWGYFYYDELNLDFFCAQCLGKMGEEGSYTVTIPGTIKKKKHPSCCWNSWASSPFLEAWSCWSLQDLRWDS